MKNAVLGFIGAVSSLSVAPASAESYHFIGDIPTLGSKIEGSFSIANSSGRYTLTSFSGHVGSVMYSLGDVALLNGADTPYSYLKGAIIIGGKQYGADGIVDGTDDFWTGWFFPKASFFASGNVASPLIKGEDNVELKFIQIASSVPEPASWGLMILGFGLSGFVVRRTRIKHSQLRYVTQGG